jgi:hypothetical protein
MKNNIFIIETNSKIAKNNILKIINVADICSPNIMTTIGKGYFLQPGME